MLCGEALSRFSVGQSVSRMGMVAGIISIIALVAFVASASDEHSGEADLLVKSQKGLQASKADKDTLAATLLMSVLHSTPENSKRILRTWRDHQIAHLDSFGSTQVAPKSKLHI